MVISMACDLALIVTCSSCGENAESPKTSLTNAALLCYVHSPSRANPAAPSLNPLLCAQVVDGVGERSAASAPRTG